MVKNYGISFGLDVPGIVYISLGLWVFLVWWWWRKKYWGLLLMIIGGGLNLGERLRLGYVTDYWKVPILGVYNNVNDWFIFVGLIILLIEWWRRR